MIDLTIPGAIVAFKYVDNQTNNALSSYAKHRMETTADYITGGAWRKLWKKTNEKLKGKEINKDPNIEFIDEILEKTKLKTDDALLELWASLLANALQGKNSIRREFFDILEKINPFDVLMLNVAMDDQYLSCLKKADFSYGTDYNTEARYISKFIADNHKIYDENEMFVSVRYLIQLGLFTENSKVLKFELTPLGKSLKTALTN
ncbi:hypothetical protein [Acetobacter orientalis]|uniref:Abi-alpha family protein n=1 Tax=Acetobacter orientalis TaxID=146474 RepID=UPI0039EBB803